MADNREKIIEALDQLKGMTSIEIGNFLLDRKMFGRRMNGEYCPIARYLASVNGRVHVERYKVIMIDETSTFLYEDKIDLPENVTRFIDQFDHGVFPELIGSYNDVFR